MAKAVKETFLEFQEYIMPLFAAKFPPKGTNFIQVDAFTKFQDKMLINYDYTPEREQFLISTTLFYIKRILPSDQSHNVCPDFLCKLANKIAENFSYYIMNKYPIPESGKSRNKLRMRVQNEIKTVLFDENPYIAALRARHEQKQKLRRKPKSVQKKFKQAAHHIKVKEAYNFERQINEMFADAQCTPRKGR